MKQFSSFSQQLALNANVCSHNERLISYQTLNDIPDMPLHAKMKLSKKGTPYVCFDSMQSAEFPFEYPWLAAAISVVGVLALVFATTRIAERKVSRLSVIEALGE